MIFVYPYKSNGSDYLIINSIKSVLKHYPEAEIVVIGSELEGFKHIPFKDSNIIRGANVTAKMLHAATLFDEFIYMNDDFFINERFDFDIVSGSDENLERKEGKASIAWNQAVDNTKHFLEHNRRPIRSYECHQPVRFNSEKLIQTMSRINWKKHDHFIKSLYFNLNPQIKVKPIDNVKLIEPNLNKANTYLTMFGCLSVGNGFLNDATRKLIKKLT